ncbi:hypothetical protein TWF694_006021 [Orbilia ellipsospora]|uniref:HNH nuclease domain-containing protein n=1 Tax=Orbilia ellipsospora TaxID=2528407 RepID=A0AAV9WX22_9PEZI
MDFHEDFDITPRPNKRTVAEREVSTGEQSIRSLSFSVNNSTRRLETLVIEEEEEVGVEEGEERSITIGSFSFSQPISRSPSPRKRRSRTPASQSSSRSSSRNSSSNGSASVLPGGSNLAFSDNLKLSLRKLYQNVCWLCEDAYSGHILDAAHVYAKADAEFQLMFDRGILPFSKVNDASNAIPLCKRCHAHFDKQHPLFIILPVDLEWFLDFERADFQQREECLRQGIDRRRLVPTAEMYRAHLASKKPDTLRNRPDYDLDLECPGGVYEVHLRGDFLTSPRERKRGAREIIGYYTTKIWHGSPTSMLLHACKSLLCVNPGQPWISDEKRRMLLELILLWSREPKIPQTEPVPVLSDLPLPLSVNGNGTTSEVEKAVPNPSNNTQDSREEEQKESESKETAELKEQEVSQPTCSSRVSSSTFVESNPGNFENEKLGAGIPKWQWGPLVTSNDVVRLFSRIEGVV